MIRRHLATLLLLLMAGFASGQDRYILLIVDSLSSEPVSDAYVYSADSAYSWTSGSDGLVIIRQRPGIPGSLRVTHIAYRDERIFLPTGHGTGPSPVIRVAMARKPGELPGITVSARRYAPAGQSSVSVESVTPRDIQASSYGNIDNSLAVLPGIFINRSNGIFSKNTSVSLRGTASAQRTLVLVDGIPLNKVSGSAVNWHLIDPWQVDGIEVMKGPGSSLYGSNALGGVINIRTKRALGDNLELGLERSSYNTTGARASVSRMMTGKVGLTASAFYRQGDGYVNIAPEMRDSIHVPLSLREGQASLRISGRDSLLDWDVSYSYYKDHRGLGRQVYEPDGEYQSLENHHADLRLGGRHGEWRYSLSLFVHSERSRTQNENLNQTGNYKLTDKLSHRQDRGAWLQLDRQLDRHSLLAGIEFRHGLLDEEDIYRTSTDHLSYGGRIILGGIYVEDLWKPAHWLELRAGARYDLGISDRGYFTIAEPSSATGFISEAYQDFEEVSYSAFSPMLSSDFRIAKGQVISLSASRGYQPPRLDDMYKSGKISKGFKLGNPGLRPETMTQLELRYRLELRPGLSFLFAAYHSSASDFHYLVATGDSIHMGADGIRPILRRENIPGIRIEGLEGSASWDLAPWLRISGSLTRQSSKVTEYLSTPDPSDDLQGNTIAEVPAWMGSLGADIIVRRYTARLSWLYTGRQWGDDQNLTRIPAYSLLNAHLSARLTNGLTASVEAWNLLDRPFVDRKGNYSPGRFLTLRLQYQLNPFKHQ